MDKNEILHQAMNQVQQVKDGNLSALDVYPILNDLKESLDELRKELYGDVIEEASKYDDREDIIKSGYKISIVRSKRYKYDHNPKYVMLDQKRKNLQSMMKKASSAKQELYDEDTGELIPPAKVKYNAYPRCEWVGEQVG